MEVVEKPRGLLERMQGACLSRGFDLHLFESPGLPWESKETVPGISMADYQSHPSNGFCFGQVPQDLQSLAFLWVSCLPSNWSIFFPPKLCLKTPIPPFWGAFPLMEYPLLMLRHEVSILNKFCFAHWKFFLWETRIEVVFIFQLEFHKRDKGGEEERYLLLTGLPSKRPQWPELSQAQTRHFHLGNNGPRSKTTFHFCPRSLSAD